MVGPDEDRVLGPLQPVPPLRQGSVYGQELTVADVVIGFGRGKATGQEGHWVDLLVLLRPLGEDGPMPKSEASTSTMN